MPGMESFKTAPIFSLNAVNLLPEFTFRATVTGCYCSAALVMCSLFVSCDDSCSVCLLAEITAVQLPVLQALTVMPIRGEGLFFHQVLLRQTLR